MPLATRDGLLHSLDELRLLSPARRTELERELLPRLADPKALAAEMLRRGWITSYQANLLLQQRGNELMLGPYLIEERLGEGGTGQVFKARHRHMNRVVALKVIRAELTADPEVVARFYREIRVISQLNHPHIIHAFDAGPVGSNHMLIMEYVEGLDLARLVKQGGPLAVSRAADYVRQAALGLQHAHEKGLIHRDVKPSNLFLARGPGRAERGAPQELVKVLDLGLARLQCNAAGDRTATLTHVGHDVMGTPDYLAPEQALDFHQVDIRADIYSLGCTLFYLLTGQPPFPGGTLAQKVLRHQQTPPPAVEQTRRDVPPGLAAALRRMLAKRPEERFASPAEVAAAMAPFAAGDGDQTLVVAEPAPATRPLTVTVPDTGNSLTLREAAPATRRRWLLVAGVGALVLAGAGVLGLRGRTGDERANAPAETGGQPVTHGEGVKPRPPGKVLVLDDCQQEVMNWWPWSTGTKDPAVRTWVTPGKVGKHALQFTYPEAPAPRAAGLNFEVAPPLRDWSAYRCLHFWFRGTGSGLGVGVGVSGSDREWSFKDDRPDWREIRAPLLEFRTRDSKGGARPEDFRAISRVVFVVYTAAKGIFQIEQMELRED